MKLTPLKIFKYIKKITGENWRYVGKEGIETHGKKGLFNRDNGNGNGFF